MSDIIFEYGITENNPVGDLFPSYRVTDRPARTANKDILNRLCPDDIHNQKISSEECVDCGAILCAICGTDRHYTSDGHDLNDPRYWGV